MLRYCAWCGEYQGAIEGEGHQIRKDVCEIDTATICSLCLDLLLKKPADKSRRQP
ncbi:hypothetical protein DSOUD_3395 [Desulfuromonas soudanensis]|uniref:Uncharacterized protein n=1 Tax=Desulfuromonas soudanensis TaxID=1603606 RepID=A0A0M4D5I1_9BACT|nr:hypothetical protein [Desulfuromonas soudanensis]ALC18114.1 hypothetical protein DSOUD_3395 [Desulfuromonas soudanensis]